MTLPPWKQVACGLELRVRAQPRARKPGVTGLVDTADGRRLRVAVTEAPEDGRATRAVIAAVAKALRVPPSSMTLVAGAASREKTLLIEGDAAELTARVAALWAAA